MIIPQYWAEARVQRRVDGRQVTARRFGWSDERQEAAQYHAEERAEDAVRRILLGEELARAEPKVPYNGADGVPIREEIIGRVGDTVITRNSYGAHCLNTPDVLFADIDFEPEPSAGLTVGLGIALGLLAVILAVILQSGWLIGVAAFVVLPLAIFGASKIHAARIRAAGGHEERAMASVTKHLRAHPQWNLRAYRTPAGYRILAMHRTFDPREPAVAEFFETLRVDPAYSRMCRLQNCFRARVSPKPWRMGINAHMRPRPGVWPVREELMGRRNQWVEEYESRAREYSSCRYVDSFGSDKVDAKADSVRKLHDDMCRSDLDLPSA